MALYYDLPVFKDVYQLILKIFVSTSLSTNTGTLNTSIRIPINGSIFDIYPPPASWSLAERNFNI